MALFSQLTKHVKQSEQSEKETAAKAGGIMDFLLLPQMFSAAIETIINKALLINSNQDINDNALNALDQASLTVQLVELSFPISLTVNAQDRHQPVIVGAMVERSDCVISTSVSTLKKIKAEQQITQLIKAGELDVEGDIKVAQQFVNIAQQLTIDWQSELAKQLGDVPTHKLIALGNQISKKIKVTSEQIEKDMTEYLVYEKRLIVTSTQINHFNDTVKEVEHQTKKLSERVESLTKNVSDKLHLEKLPGSDQSTH